MRCGVTKASSTPARWTRMCGVCAKNWEKRETLSRLCAVLVIACGKIDHGCLGFCFAFLLDRQSLPAISRGANGSRPGEKLLISLGESPKRKNRGRFWSAAELCRAASD